VFLDAYNSNQSGAHEYALDASPIPGALVSFMEDRGEWDGTAKELLAALNGTLPTRGLRTDFAPIYSGGWSKRPNGLTNALRRAAPAAPSPRAGRRLQRQAVRGPVGREAEAGGPDHPPARRGPYPTVPPPDPEKRAAGGPR
jgi:hypothetical protein